MTEDTTRRKALAKLGLLALAGYVAPAIFDLAGGKAEAAAPKRSRARSHQRGKYGKSRRRKHHSGHHSGKTR